MRFLIDTNILIPLEPTAASETEVSTKRATTFVRLVASGNHTLLLHPEAFTDLARDKDGNRRQTRMVLASKYPLLEQPPSLDAISGLLGRPDEASHDWVDHHLLAAVHADAIDYVVTEDGRMRRKAARLDVSDRVLSLDDAIGLLGTLAEVRPDPPPLVDSRQLHSVDLQDPIFSSLRDDYAGFDQWFRTAARAGRQGWVVSGTDGNYAGICFLKPDDDEYRLGGKVLKLSTFKVATENQGNRYGELLLKTLFDYVRLNSYLSVWVTVFEKHASLIALLEQFGFERLNERSPLDEAVYAKSFRTQGVDTSTLDSLSLHVRYGPPCARITAGTTFVIPIQPHFHQMLFPDFPDPVQPLFQSAPGPFGNALRKAYLCNSSISQIAPGSTLLFYRSRDLRSVTTVGVVDRVMRSANASQIIRFVGQRTVYSEAEIHRLAQSPVLAILFRQDRFLDVPLGRKELQAHRVITSAPQSITTVRSEDGVNWLRKKIGALC
jgi:L-amino acid N-acyltransferase YncA